MTSRGQCPRGGACECPRVGAFFKLMTSRGECPRGGGCAWCSTHPSSDPPPTGGYGPEYMGRSKISHYQRFYHKVNRHIERRHSV